MPSTKSDRHERRHEIRRDDDDYLDQIGDMRHMNETAHGTIMGILTEMKRDLTHRLDSFDDEMERVDTKAGTALDRATATDAGHRTLKMFVLPAVALFLTGIQLIVMILLGLGIMTNKDNLRKTEDEFGNRILKTEADFDLKIGRIESMAKEGHGKLEDAISTLAQEVRNFISMHSKAEESRITYQSRMDARLESIIKEMSDHSKADDQWTRLFEREINSIRYNKNVPSYEEGSGRYRDDSSSNSTR